MLFLLFELGHDRYALDVRQIAEVLPLIEVKQIPHAPPAITGLLSYRGVLVPVIDLSQLTLGRPAARRLSTRIVLVHYPGASGRSRLLGLIVEKATQAARHETTEFVASGVTDPGAARLGPGAPVANDARGLLQWIDIPTLLPASLRDLLFNEPGDNQWGLPTSPTS
jgi:chemotaxis-related protein WspB